MDCLLHLAASLCLLSPTELTLRADISRQVSGVMEYRIDGRSYGGGHVGRVQLDMPLVTYRGFRIVGGYEHESLVDTRRDRGQERVFLGISYRVFGGGL